MSSFRCAGNALVISSSGTDVLHSHYLQVVMAQPGGDAADSLELTEDKRTAIQGAMKNISLDYMPQWAAAVPEQAWIKVLKTKRDT